MFFGVLQVFGFVSPSCVFRFCHVCDSLYHYQPKLVSYNVSFLHFLDRVFYSDLSIVECARAWVNGFLAASIVSSRYPPSRLREKC